jgi:hypothetical protein
MLGNWKIYKAEELMPPPEYLKEHGSDYLKERMK